MNAKSIVGTAGRTTVATAGRAAGLGIGVVYFGAKLVQVTGMAVRVTGGLIESAGHSGELKMAGVMASVDRTTEAWSEAITAWETAQRSPEPVVQSASEPAAG